MMEMVDLKAHHPNVPWRSPIHMAMLLKDSNQSAQGNITTAGIQCMQPSIIIIISTGCSLVPNVHTACLRGAIASANGAAIRPFLWRRFSNMFVQPHGLLSFGYIHAVITAMGLPHGAAIRCQELGSGVIVTAASIGRHTEQSLCFHPYLPEGDVGLCTQHLTTEHKEWTGPCKSNHYS